MATIINDRDVLLQATSPRNNAPSLGKAFILSADSALFKVVSGTPTPTLINLTTQRIAINSTVSWGVTGATGLTIAGDTYSATLAYSAMTANSAVVTAQTTYLGVTYIQSQIINKVQDGTNGSPGGTGARGTVTLVGTGYSSWSDSSAASVISSNGSGSPQNGDIVTLTNSSSFTQTKFYSFGTWYVLTAYIDGNLLVSGTLSASKVNGGVLTGVTIGIGSGHTLNGYSFEVTSGGQLWADNFTCGLGSFGNTYQPGYPALLADVVDGNPCVRGRVNSGNSYSAAVGVEGANSYANKIGKLGTNAYAVYAQTGAYGPFTGSHDCILAAGYAAEPGDILIDQEDVGSAPGVSDTIFTVEVSSTPRQKGSSGVLEHVAGLLEGHTPAALVLAYLDDGPPVMSEYYNENCHRVYYAVMNALGEGKINVCGEGGNIEAGDYIVTSSTPGKGMRQADDVLRNYTVARARESVAFSSPSEIKQVACIYLCG